MKIIFVLLATFLVAQASVVEPPKVTFQDAEVLALLPAEFAEYGFDEFEVAEYGTSWCLIKLAWKLKKIGINGIGPWKDLVEDLVNTTYSLAQHALKCRRLKKDATTIWGEIAYQACRASLAAQGVYDVLRLKKEIKETIETDFWLAAIKGLRQCLKKDTEVLISMDYETLDKELEHLYNH